MQTPVYETMDSKQCESKLVMLARLNAQQTNAEDEIWPNWAAKYLNDSAHVRNMADMFILSG